MSERETPETDSFVPLRVHHPSLPSWNDYVLASFAQKLERERDQARDLARELRDALENCREDSVELLGEWAWKRGTIPRNDRAIEELEGRVSIADSVMTKAKEVLP